MPQTEAYKDKHTAETSGSLAADSMLYKEQEDSGINFSGFLPEVQAHSASWQLFGNHWVYQEAKASSWESVPQTSSFLPPLLGGCFCVSSFCLTFPLKSR